MLEFFSRRWREWFKEQVNSWAKEDIINSDQRDVILDRYGDDFGPPSILHRNRLISIIGVLGALLVGFGIILLIASNWQVMAPVSKMVIMVFSVVVFYGIGYALKYENERYQKTGHAFIFLGHLNFGASIWLIAQVYNLSAHYPDGFLYWLIGVLAMSLVLELYTGLILSSILLIGWIGAEIGYTTELMLELPFWSKAFTKTVLLYPILGGFVLWGSYKHKTKTTLFFLLGSFVLWINFVSIRFIEKVESSNPPLLIVTLLTGFIFYWWGDYEETWGNWSYSSVIYRLWAGTIIFAQLFTLSFVDAVEVLLEANFSISSLQIVIFSSLGILLAILGIILYFRNDHRLRKNLLIEAITGAIITAVIGFGHFPYDGSMTGYIVATNILAIAASLGFLAKGFFHGQFSLAIGGLLGFSFLFVARYFSIAWRFLPRSFFFITGGIVLLVISFLFEFLRRRLAASMMGEAQ